MATQIRLTADGRFRLLFSYGAADRYAEGSWQMAGDSLILSTRPAPPHDFRLDESRTGKDSLLIIEISSANTRLYPFVQCIINKDEANQLYEVPGNGKLVIPFTPVKDLELLFRLCPERSSRFTFDKPNLQYLRFSFEPWFCEIFFQRLAFNVTAGKLTGPHPLLSRTDLVYVRDQ